MTQNRVLVLFADGSEAMPCHPARARQLLDADKAAVYRHQPFTIILTEREDGETQDVECKVDPGSQTTGLALVAKFKGGRRLVWAANLEHRGDRIKEDIRQRRQARKSRRKRNTRYRKPRHQNRTKPKGWLPPSTQSRVDNIREWAKRLSNWSPVTQIRLEINDFDTRKMQDPEIEREEYLDGPLEGTNLREQLLQKFDRSCVYCGQSGVRMELDHVTPRSRGGTDKPSNLVLACEDCNREKDDQPLEEFLEDDDKISWLRNRQNEEMRHAGVMTSMKYQIGEELKKVGPDVAFHAGVETKRQRDRQGLPKDHWIDAALVGGERVQIDEDWRPLKIKAEGRGRRQLCLMDKHGFPRTSPKQEKRVDGFQTGDLVRAEVPEKYKSGGTHRGKVSIRSRGTFVIYTDAGRVDGVNSKYCELLQHSDGYSYSSH